MYNFSFYTCTCIWKYIYAGCTCTLINDKFITGSFLHSKLHCPHTVWSFHSQKGVKSELHQRVNAFLTPNRRYTVSRKLEYIKVKFPWQRQLFSHEFHSEPENSVSFCSNDRLTLIPLSKSFVPASSQANTVKDDLQRNCHHFHFSWSFLHMACSNIGSNHGRCLICF